MCKINDALKITREKFESQNHDYYVLHAAHIYKSYAESRKYEQNFIGHEKEIVRLLEYINENLLQAFMMSFVK